MSTQTLAKSFYNSDGAGASLAHPHIQLTEDANGLRYIEIDNPLAKARIALQGGHVIHWQPKTEKQPVLWLSEHARYVKGRSIRGGVPICWPWFGAHQTDSTLCPHGFARVIPWQLVDSDTTDTGATRLLLQMQETDVTRRQLGYPYVLTMTITVGKRLKIDLATTNKADHPFIIGEAFHTYFNISDVANVKITGLQDYVYADKLKNYQRYVEHEVLTFDGEFDRVYLNHSGDCLLSDPGYKRRIRVSTSNSRSTVIWTPWEEKAHSTGDMGSADEWRNMICIESANAMENMVVINPNRTHIMSAEYTVESM
ncbi:D-hexose-6-phosphate mutarotase [Methylobacillus flagellatus]|uniref:D-hexose-6-phosphate mutarotase n=1 Tax=Methylobacillus flagellatus TaxID=405 RepID=UPI0010F5EAAB|nr:D-hexose-6-phosphate mutarotase [Methylobacillus flagellatus]